MQAGKEDRLSVMIRGWLRGKPKTEQGETVADTSRSADDLGRRRIVVGPGVFRYRDGGQEKNSGKKR